MKIKVNKNHKMYYENTSRSSIMSCPDDSYNWECVSFDDSEFGDDCCFKSIDSVVEVLRTFHSYGKSSEEYDFNKSNECNKDIKDMLIMAYNSGRSNKRFTVKYLK